MHRIPRFAPALLFVLSLGLLGLGVGPCAGVVVLSPAPEEVLLAPEVEVSLLFLPRLRPMERVRVELEAGIDTPVGPERRDLSRRERLRQDGERVGNVCESPGRGSRAERVRRRHTLLRTKRSMTSASSPVVK